MAERTYDLIVIGGGPAGENAASYALQAGLGSCALVEAELVGGECSYYACMPSKALLRPIDVAATAAQLRGLRGELRVDPAELLARRDYWVSNYDDAGQVSWAEGAGIDVIRGRGSLAGERRVLVDGEILQARHAVVLATGSVAAVPDALRDLLPWTSRDVTGLTEIPDSIAILGGGVVACEAARWLAALGNRVTMLVRSRVLGNAERFAGDLVAESLRAAGVDVRLGVTPVGANRPAPQDSGLGRVHGGPITLSLDDGSPDLVVSELLVAAGRTRATDDLGLETIGLQPDSLLPGGERPDWLYAVGDVSGEAPLTHWGKYRARLVGETIAARAAGRPEPTTPPEVPVPQVVFTDPQVAWVGHTEASARAAGLAVEVVDVPLSAASGASLLRDDLVGQARLVIEADSHGDDRRILGATFVGPEVADLLHSATVAILGRLPLGLLWHAVPSYPTPSEIWLRLLEKARS